MATYKSYEIYGVDVVCDSDISKEEAAKYVEYVEDKYERKLSDIEIKLDGEMVDLEYHFKTVPFERIRRITGYLVGTMERWNDAKTAEEHDRVKHSTEMETL